MYVSFPPLSIRLYFDLNLSQIETNERASLFGLRLDPARK